MKLTLHPEDTGKKNWEDPRNCPIAMSLKRLGYNEVFIRSLSWMGQINNEQQRGKITPELNNKAKQWATMPIKKPLEFEL